MENSRDDLACSFRGNKNDEVEQLIAGPNVFICNECVELCNEIRENKGASSSDRALVNCNLCEKPNNRIEMMYIEDRGFLCGECIPIVQAEIIFWNSKEI
jgi:hypothetical protein